MVESGRRGMLTHEFPRAEVAECRMKTPSIVDQLDLLENCCPGMCTGRKLLVGVLRCQGGKETLLNGIVPAIAGAANADGHVCLG